MREEVLYSENLVTNQTNGQNLDYVSFSLNVGEVLGITGLNGDGLSVLSDVLTGVLKPVSGNIYLNGEKVSLDSPEKARQMGICEIKDSLSIVPYMTVAENMNVLRPFSWGEFFIKPRGNLETTKKVSEYYGLRFDPDSPAQKLTYAQRTELSICRALLCGAKILICQEAGEGFTELELEQFSQFLKKLCRKGISVILINSDARMSLRFSDRVAVMRSGMICYLRETKAAVIDEMYCCMSPQKIGSITVDSPDVQSRGNNFYLRDLSALQKEKQFITTELHGGETLGLIWNSRGAEDLVYRMFSGKIPVTGTVIEDGREFEFSDWRKRNAKNIYCLRKRFWRDALYDNMTVAENIMMRTYNRFHHRASVLKMPMLRLALEEFSKSHQIDPDCLECCPRHLNVEMRNQIVLWGMLFAPPKLLVLDSPSFAIDEQTKQNLLRCIEELKANKTAIFWSNNDGMTLYNHCDRVVTIQNK